MLNSGKQPGKDILLVDLRRNDHEVGDESGRQLRCANTAARVEQSKVRSICQPRAYTIVCRLC